MEFEIWLYRGLIGGLMVIVTYLFKTKDTGNEQTIRDLKQSMKEMQETIAKLNITINILNTTLKNQQEICKIKHKAIDSFMEENGG